MHKPQMAVWFGFFDFDQSVVCVVNRLGSFVVSRRLDRPGNVIIGSRPFQHAFILSGRIVAKDFLDCLGFCRGITGSVNVFKPACATHDVIVGIALGNFGPLVSIMRGLLNQNAWCFFASRREFDMRSIV